MKFCPECAAPQATQSVVANVQDSVVAGGLNITQIGDSGRVECRCGATGQIALYNCQGCEEEMCDACRFNHSWCRHCWAEREAVVDTAERDAIIVLVAIFGVAALAGLMFFVF